ncbi:MAG: GNAT family N-acetyltransferase [Streptosporangiaceae bacterium]|jgi:predicted GNAT family acetyltransferase
MAESVIDNPGKMRYEIHEDGEVAGYVTYGREGKTIIFLHTETDPRFRGEGLGGRLVQASLDDARKRGLGVLPYCPFVRDWIAGHPEYADLVPAAQRAEFGL